MVRHGRRAWDRRLGMRGAGMRGFPCASTHDERETETEARNGWRGWRLHVLGGGGTTQVALGVSHPCRLVGRGHAGRVEQSGLRWAAE